MKQNPCRYCELALRIKSRHYPGCIRECYECEKRKKHAEHLKSQRKFTEGEQITTLQELLEQEWVMWYHHLKHIEIIKSNQLRLVMKQLEIGAFHKAIKKESEE